MNETNFWLTTVERPGFPEAPLPARVDVAVVGGGYSGLSAALTLARAGTSVAVLEAGTVGWGASSRNGGMVLTGMKLGIETLVRRYGLERARAMFRLSLSAIDTVERVVREQRIACSFSRFGHLELAWKSSHFEGYRRTAGLLDKDFGHPVQILSRRDLSAEIESPLYHGGVVDQASAGLNPARYVMGLAQAAVRAGAKVHEQTRVESVDRAGTRFRVGTNRGVVEAAQVFVGTSGYTDRAFPDLRKRLVPIGSYVIATAPLPPGLATRLIPRGRMIFDSKNYLYYFRLTPDGRMLFGGRAAFMPETRGSIRRSAGLLRRGLLEVFPQLAGVPTDYVWGGTLDFATDLMPHAGELGGTFHAVGYAGHGVAFASHLGQLVARRMLGEAVENPLEGLPFHKPPLYDGRPWFLPLAGVYYGLLDWLT